MPKLFDENITPKDFEDLAEPFIDGLQHIINKMPHKGDKRDSSQKLELQTHLNNLQYAINGLTQEDFKKE